MSASATANPIKVLIVEDDAVTRRALSLAIESSPELKLVGALDAVKPAVEWLATGQIDVLLTDLGLPDGTGIDVIRACVRHLPKCDIMVITMSSDDDNVLACVKRGVNVIQLNLDQGLSLFDDDSFDVVLQIDTLQHLRNAETMLRETARVGKLGIVAFPNFAHWPNRLSVLRGRMPVTKRLPYQWYDTPNIRVGTFKDFEVLATRNKLVILDAFGLQDGRERRVLPNLVASTAVFKFERG